MILLVTNKSDLTTDLLVVALASKGIPFARLNTEDWMSGCLGSIKVHDSEANGALCIGDQRIQIQDISAIYYRRPLPPVPLASGPEDLREFSVRESKSLLYSLLNSTTSRWINNPTAIRVAQDKVLQMKLATQLQFAIPDTLFTSDIDEARRFAARYSNGFIAKSFYSPMVGKGDQRRIIYSQMITPEHLDTIDSIADSPTIFQEYIDKVADIRVTVVGAQAFGMWIGSQEHPSARHDWRASEERLRQAPHVLPFNVRDKCISLTRALGLAVSAVDLCLDKFGNYTFLEINPNGEWAWVETQCKLPIAAAIADELSKESVTYDKDVLKIHQEMVNHMYGREEQRRDGVERQAMTVLGTTGVITTILLGLGQLLLTYSEKNMFFLSISLAPIFLAMLISFLLAIVFSLQTLRRIPIHVLLPDEAAPSSRDVETTYRLRINQLLVGITKKNYDKTDWKVRNLKRAQRALYFGIISMLLGGLCILLFSLENVLRPSLSPSRIP